jgi:hypothetical protein
VQRLARPSECDRRHETQLEACFQQSMCERSMIVAGGLDVTGNWILQSIAFDDGSSAVASLDPSNHDPWSLVWDSFNATGDWISQSIDSELLI